MEDKFVQILAVRQGLKGIFSIKKDFKSWIDQ